MVGGGGAVGRCGGGPGEAKLGASRLKAALYYSGILYMYTID